ncbi:TMV resistance protein N-like [Gossypium hirsutum]|uniref:TMV resistance protein N-like n=1 Tax=Gossypium hirsutum TaxID=3635 RepID=A0A1U8KM81_GOSHI|nr:TMV resistance protein N-like [Gossypium hirsutum]
MWAGWMSSFTICFRLVSPGLFAFVGICARGWLGFGLEGTFLRAFISSVKEMLVRSLESSRDDIFASYLSGKFLPPSSSSSRTLFSNSKVVAALFFQSLGTPPSTCPRPALVGAGSISNLTTSHKSNACSLKAFKSETPAKEFFELFERVVEYANGLPLALEVFGSFLSGRSDEAQWRSAIERLKKEYNKEILDKLQISFDGLEQSKKDIFLDIACIFKEEDKDMVTKILDGCGFFPDIGIYVLIKKSLITIDENNKLSMHELLQKMGRKIVYQESPNEAGKRCRLWEEKDTYYVLIKNTLITLYIVKLIPLFPLVVIRKQNTWTLSADAFLKIKRLRLLRFLNAPNSRDIKYLSNELRLLEWHGYPFKSFPSSFQPEKLVALLLPYSFIQKLWKPDMPLHKLKLVDLKCSRNLVKTPDFRMVPNIESLVLEGTGIADFHPSIRFLRRLKLLNLRNCKSLGVSLPKLERNLLKH